MIVKQFGFSTASGAIANVVDGNLSVGWAPLTTDFSGYPDQFFIGDPSLRVLNYGKAFPALEFDLGAPRRVPQIYVKVQSGLTLGPGILIGSEVGATSAADTLQTGDVFLAEYTQQQIVSNLFLDVPAMRDADIKKRYLRLLQRSALQSVIQPTPGPTNSWTVDLPGVGHWVVPTYTEKLTIEGWGAGASGGLAAFSQNGSMTTVSKSGWGTTPTANGGNKPTATSPNSSTGAGTGGTASGANVLNTTGNSGGVPSTFDSSIGFSGKGGDAPFGGGGALAVWLPLILGIGLNWRYGYDGTPPGGGGSGRNYWYPSGDVIYQKFPGGGSGAYFKHEILLASGDANPGSVIDYLVGTGGVSSTGDGRGANGRVRFSWT